LQAGSVSRGAARVAWVLSLLVFVGSLFFLHPKTFMWAPVALVALVGYPYLKRFTALAHFGVGFVLSLAPLGATLAVTGEFTPSSVILSTAVLLWVAGFDILYSLLDMEFDKKEGLQSLPSLLGVDVSLWISRLAHINCMILLVMFGLFERYFLPYWFILFNVGLIFMWEHKLVRPGDLSKVNQAFFTANGWVGVLVLAGVLLESGLNHLISGGV